MKLSDFPARDVCSLLWSIIDRYRASKSRQSFGKSVKTEVHLTIDDARMFYAGGQWLRRYSDWNEEAIKSGGSIGVYPAKTSLKDAAKWMVEKASSINKDERTIILSAKDMKIMESVAQHLDHYALMTAISEKSNKRNWKSK